MFFTRETSAARLCIDRIEAYKEDVESKAKNALEIRF